MVLDPWLMYNTFIQTNKLKEIKMSKEYRVIRSLKAASLEDDVNWYLKNGWVLVGGVAIAVNSNTGETEFAQAMLKVEEE
jgi:hypothetical protein